MYIYNDFDEALRLRDIVNDFFTNSQYRTRGTDFPYVEIYEGKEGLDVRAIIPGVKSEDLTLNLIDNSLIIEVEKKADYEDKPYIRKERQFGDFKKSVKLPYRVDSKKISAELKDGILIVKLTKSEDAKPKKISVN